MRCGGSWMAWTVKGSVSLNLFINEAPSAVCRIRSTYGMFTTYSEGWRMAYVLPDGMQVAVEVTYVDADGNPAVVDGVVGWISSNDAIATVTSTGPTAATIAATKGGTLGTAQITASADADLGSGSKELLTTFDVNVVAGEAVAGTISPTGAPTPI